MELLEWQPEFMRRKLKIDLAFFKHPTYTFKCFMFHTMTKHFFYTALVPHFKGAD